MAENRRPLPTQLSQMEILEILQRVKRNEITIEDAILLSEEGGKETANLPPNQQYNFNVYKFRYRWQKRILQIDFFTQMIFNIEKGTLKKQFPFEQVKSCADNDGLRFVISFHGHQNYELEAACMEDKQSILKILNEILQMQKNSQTSPVKTFVKKNSFSDVILEGLLERLDNLSDKWVKYLVKVKRDELMFYCSQKLVPEKISVNMSDCTVSAGTYNSMLTFSVHCTQKTYTFRIPLNEQNKSLEKTTSMRDDWVSILQDLCLQKNDQLPLPAVYEDLEMDKEEVIYNQHNPNTQCLKMEDPLQIYEEVPLQPLVLENQTSIEATEKRPCFPASPQVTTLCPILPPSLPVKIRIVTPSPTLTKTKAFHWNIVPLEKINKSMWGQNSKTQELQKKIDAQRILHQFQTSHSSFAVESDITKHSNILLDQKIAHNFNIILKRFHMEPEQLNEKLLIIRECNGGLSDEHLTNLRRYVPTAKDRSMYLGYKGSPAELHIVDQFMLQMCKIPDLCPRLDALLAIRELPLYMKDIQPLISQKIKSCKQLLHSQAFPAVLAYILAMGNCLNERTGKGRAKGFQLSTLTKMSQLVSKEKSFTFLHALVEQILLQEPDLAKFSQQLTEFEAIPGASVKGLNAEVDVLSKQLETIDQYRKSFKSKHSKPSASEEKFLKELKEILEHYGTQNAELTKKATEMKKLYSEVLQKFGEAEDQDSQELFGWISSFIKEFKNAYLDLRPSH
ncbi:disheveled-associated activator of morphogenesis 1-like isoform X1 [Bufo bufo]|uniref:disheveled-associated activator of morphogenesis 1-like isoform X1 n=1 Tax=Bufo bufo TaxID=8384 RepID=UPI001ABED3D2|nr:disheveled-associated activator of morphogenesis 1-like isoform X1 [Bufo bufo]